MSKENLEKAKRELSRIEKIIYDEKSARLEKEYAPLIQQAEQVKSIVRKEVDIKYNAELSSARIALNDAQQAADKEAIQEAASLWHPPGTIVHEWVYKGYTAKQRTKSGERAIISIWTNESEAPGNIGRWSMPNIGDLILLPLKKDGTPGKKFIQIAKYGKLLENEICKWYLENETPES